MNIKNFLLAAGLFSIAANANAILVIQISDTADFSGTIVEAVDTDNDGLVTLNSSISGTTWIANVVTGVSDHDSNQGQMHLNSVNVSSLGDGGSVFIRLTDTDYIGTGAVISYGGTTDGTVSFQSYVDASNTAFGTDTLLSDSGAISTASFSGDDSTFTGIDGLFAMSIYAAITHEASYTNFRITSFDYDVKVPEPATLSLLGLGLLLLAFATRRKKISK